MVVAISTASFLLGSVSGLGLPLRMLLRIFVHEHIARGRAVALYSIVVRIQNDHGLPSQCVKLDERERWE